MLPAELQIVYSKLKQYKILFFITSLVVKTWVYFMHNYICPLNWPAGVFMWPSVLDMALGHRLGCYPYLVDPVNDRGKSMFSK